MARTPRIQYPGAIYHVMARGNRKENIVLGDDDRWMFLHTLREMAKRTGIIVHAFALMNNHYHLVIETPRANLVDGMQWFQNTYTRRFNVKHKAWGHLFGGRYKAILVEHGDAGYFKTLIDYVHLNPVRAGLVKEGHGFDSYQWTSLREYRKPPGKRQEWIETSDGLAAVELEDTSKGRAAYILRLEKIIDWQKPEKSGYVIWEEQSLQSTLKRGWYFGSQDFKEKLIHLIPKKHRDEDHKNRAAYTSGELKDYDKVMAELIVREGLTALNIDEKDFQTLPKNDHRKVLLAHILTEQTSVPLQWIANTLQMGTTPYVSKLSKEMKNQIAKHPKLIKTKEQIIQLADAAF